MQIKKEIYNLINSQNDKIESWFEEKYSRTMRLFYSSVDVRHSGYKIAPVDTNLFPAGFNLLTDKQKIFATAQAKLYISKNYPSAKNILLIAENHTRNKYYLQNIFSIKTILEKAGFNIYLSRFDLEINNNISEAQETQPETILETADGTILEYSKIKREDNKILIQATFNNQPLTIIPDVILVNNDMTGGAPEILANLDFQPVFPPVGMGWYRRKKTGHFEAYNIIARDFARNFNLDPWLISTLFTKCGNINFKEKEGLDCVAGNAQILLDKIKIKYAEYGIKDEPYIFIKANSGTYGMGIMTVKNSSEILDINKKERHSMNVIKEGVGNSDVIIQEGVPTIDEYNNMPAEPLIYLVNSTPVGCTYRVNSSADKFGNLNSKGMGFFNFDCDRDKNLDEKESSSSCPVQTLIARLANLAASREIN